jgi:hypothetical protein
MSKKPRFENQTKRELNMLAEEAREDADRWKQRYMECSDDRDEKTAKIGLQEMTIDQLKRDIETLKAEAQSEALDTKYQEGRAAAFEDALEMVTGTVKDRAEERKFLRHGPAYGAIL